MYQFLHPTIFIPLAILGFLFIRKTISVRNYNRKGVLMLGTIDKFFVKNFISLSNSTIVWNVIFWVAFIGTTLVYPEIGNGFALINSVFLAAICIFDESDMLNKQTWPAASYLFIIIGIMFLVGMQLAKVCTWIYKNTITRFNNWVNNF